MTIVHPPSTERDTNAIEHLDFAPPCDYVDHECYGSGPVILAVWFTPKGPSCGCPNTPFAYYCDGCWSYRNSVGYVMCDCGAVEGAWASVLRVERI